MSGTILITGAAGKTGVALTRRLAHAGASVRAAVRNREQARRAVANGATQAVIVDLDTGEGLAEAVDGAGHVYLIAPNVHPREPELVADVLHVAAKAGVSRVVYHSVMHPHHPAMPHHMAKAAAEHEVRESGLEWSILQPAAYLQNHVGALLSGHLSVPYNLDSVFSSVDLDDVAHVATSVLLQGGHEYATYELAGAERLTMRQLGWRAEQILGRPVTVEQVTPRPPSVDDYSAAALHAMFAAYDRHGFVGGCQVLRALLGREPAGVGAVLSRLGTSPGP